MESSSSPANEPRSGSPGGRLPPRGETPVIVVDDDQDTVEVLVQFFHGRGYDTHGFSDPGEALTAIRANPPHLLITDRNMPGMGGLDLARLALEEDPDIGVVVLTGATQVEMAVEAFRLGAADYVLKPLDFGEIEGVARRILLRRSGEIFHRDTEARMRNELAIRTRELEKKNELLKEVNQGALMALVRTLEERSPHFQGHSQAVAELAEGLAQELGLRTGEVRACKLAGFLHDIGMIAVPDHIMEKDGPLSPEETRRVQAHCGVGKKILEPLTYLGPVPDYVLLHHERVDGSGYPTGLRGEEIPVGAQVVALADSFRALVEPRPYRTAHPVNEAIDILLGTSGIWHAPDILKAFVRVMTDSP